MAEVRISEKIGPAFFDVAKDVLAHGHTHYDLTYVDDGVRSFSTPCDKADSRYDYTRTLGTISEQCFDIVTIDDTANYVYLTRIGAGNDRALTI